jgi:hypothetical protein
MCLLNLSLRDDVSVLPNRNPALSGTSLLDVYRFLSDRIIGSTDALLRLGRLFESRVVEGPQSADSQLLDVRIDFSFIFAC